MLTSEERQNRNPCQSSAVQKVWKELGNFDRLSESTCRIKIRVQSPGDERDW